MRDDPLVPPTLASLAGVLPAHGDWRFDRTLRDARNEIGDYPDPANPQHARRLRKWLNDWLCRIGYPTGDSDVFTDSLAAWWVSHADSLPPAGTRLAQLTEGQIDRLSCAYADLYVRPAAVDRRGRIRRIAPTAAAKLLYFVRPCTVTAWDRAISLRTGGGRDGEAFRAHLDICRRWAANLETEGQELGLRPSEIGPSLGRPESSVAKLIDEWLYATVTRRLHPGAGRKLMATP